MVYLELFSTVLFNNLLCQDAVRENFILIISLFMQIASWEEFCIIMIMCKNSFKDSRNLEGFSISIEMILSQFCTLHQLFLSVISFCKLICKWPLELWVPMTLLSVCWCIIDNHCYSGRLVVLLMLRLISVHSNREDEGQLISAQGMYLALGWNFGHYIFNASNNYLC